MKQIINKMIKKLVEKINNSDLLIRLIENGAGLPISNNIFKYPCASKTIYQSESYYSKEAFELQFGKSNHRTVSCERLKEINDLEIFSNNYNTLVLTTFQVGYKNNISTHGWVSINKKDGDITYYHISLHESLTRKQYIKSIGIIGIKLISDIKTDCHVDIVLDRDLKPLYNETLSFISESESNDNISVFTSDGKITRMEDVTRGVDELILYKGSFNPVHNWHLKTIQTIELEKKCKGYFCLSFNTYEKGKQSIESFYNRIKLLNEMGYSVIVNNRSMFRNLHDTIRLKYSKDINFIMGSDTLDRFSRDYNNTNIKYFNTDFINTNFSIFPRVGYVVGDNCKKLFFGFDNIKEYNETKDEISSSKIRELISNKDFETLKELIPTKIYNKIINNYGI